MSFNFRNEDLAEHIIYGPIERRHYKLADLLTLNPINKNKRNIDTRMMELKARVELMKALKQMGHGYGRFDFNTM